MNRVLVLGVIVCLASCHPRHRHFDDDEEMPLELAAWTPAGASAALQGTWLGWLGFNTTGARDPIALEIAGDKATAWDGTVDRRLEVEIATPCLIRFAESVTTPEGGTSVWDHDVQFLLVDGKLQIAEGAVGMRKGKTALICAIGSPELTTVDEAGGCLAWTRPLHEWQSTPTPCAWGTQDGKETLTLGTDEHWKTVVFADGDRLKTEQFAESIVGGRWHKTADLATAKRLRSYWDHRNEYGRRTDDTPATVGDLASVRGIAATTKIPDQAIELTAVVSAIRAREGGGFALELVDQPGFTDPSIDCLTTTTGELVPWTKVVVKGTLTIHGSLRIVDCTAAPAR